MEAKNIVVNGTSYPTNIPSKLVDVLEKCRLNKTRIVIEYGYTETGISFGEIHDTTGYVGRTTGDSKVPIMLYNTRSDGGMCLMLNRILNIKESKGKKLIYSHK